MNNVEIEKRDLENKIADGFSPPCPRCNFSLNIKSEEGNSGAIGYSYECSNKKCELPRGYTYLPSFRVIGKALQKKTLQLTLTIIGSITLTALIGYATGLFRTQTNTPEYKNDFPTHLQKLIDNADNNFEKNRFEEILAQYKQMTGDKRVDIAEGKGNVFFMAKAVDATNKSIQAINATKAETWGKELTPYAEANKRALQRGVNIKRIFMLPGGIKTENDVKQFTLLMKQQKEDGIEVFFTFENQIRLIPFYANTPFYACALFDEKYLGYDQRIEYLSGDLFPVVSRFTWNKEELKEKSPFPEIFNSPYVNKYEDSSEQMIKAHYNIQN